jgi:DNA modification methylase
MIMPTPDWQSDDGKVQLYCADCMDILPQIPDGEVDAVVTDIPYGAVNRKSGGLRSLDKGVADTETFAPGWAASEASRLAPSVYLWCGTEQVSEIRATMSSLGMTTRMCGWEKTNPSPMNGQHLWLSSFECCVFGRRRGAYFARHCKSPIWRGPVQHAQQHKTQKPDWLMVEQVTASTPEGGVVLDFTIGSGTTAVACVKTGRQCIGIEKERKYFDIAVERVQRAYADRGIFAEATP